MRRVLTLIFVAALLLTPGYAPMAHAQPSALPSAQVATTGTVIKTANLRAGPGTTFAIVGSAQVELNGTQYVVSVPIKIDIDATVPLSQSVTSVEDGRRVGQYAINILSNEESDKDIDVLMPTPFGKSEEKEFEPTEGKKIAVVRFEVANVGDEPLTLYTHQVKGVDDGGRLFEEKDLACLAANPGESTECVIVFEIEQANHIAALDVEVADHQQLAVPGVE